MGLGLVQLFRCSKVSELKCRRFESYFCTGRDLYPLLFRTAVFFDAFYTITVWWCALHEQLPSMWSWCIIRIICIGMGGGGQGWLHYRRWNNGGCQTLNIFSEDKAISLTTFLFSAVLINYVQAQDCRLSLPEVLRGGIKQLTRCL